MTYNPNWAERIKELLIKQTERKVAKSYKQAINNVQVELSNLYDKYSDKGILTYAEMAKYNRLNSLNKTLIEDLNTSWKNIESDLRSLVGEEYSESYYRYGFLLNKTSGINLNYGLIDKEVIRSLFNKPNVSGLSLKETLSRTRYNLLLKERQAMVQGFLRGDSYVNLVKDLKETFNKSFNDTLRIVRTEGTRAANDGQVAVYDDAEGMGLEFDRIWVATLDSRTRDSHQALDGQIADKEGYFHHAGAKAKAPGNFGIASEDINCRCTVIAQPKETQPKIRRSNIGDKEIIKYKSYEEWKKDQK
jgi:SPP1 gp7 family putative phage head morphogenesis protein